MKDEALNELNTFLQGEHMAVNVYEKYIQKVDDKKVKKTLQNIQQEHKQHAVKIAERIQNLGGKPEDQIGLAGKMATLMSKIKSINKNDTSSIIKLAHDGERKGIEMAEEIIKGDLDKKSTSLIKDILNNDRQHLDILKNLINKTEIYTQ